jgi:hypothetical protein
MHLDRKKGLTLFQAGGLAAAGFLAGSTPAPAQNILTNNPSFESNAPFINATGNVDGIPGWHAVMIDTTPGTYNSFVGAAGDQPNTTGRDGSNFGYFHGATLETSAASRGAVTAGQQYQLSFLLKNDQGLGDTNSVSVKLAFYDNNTTYGTALPASVMQTFTLTSVKVDANGGGAFTPETMTGIAPAGATFAGVELNAPTSSTYITDNYSLTAVPEPGSLGLLGVAGAMVMRRRRTA